MALASDILVIEDDPTIGRLLSDIFALGGRAARVAPSAAVASEQLAEARPAFMTLDLNMPDMHGSRFLEQVRERPETRDIPVIVITSQVPVTNELRSMAEAVVAKPFDLEELLAVVERVVPGALSLAA
jgi:CheY-like chemotaxis protein